MRVLVSKTLCVRFAVAAEYLLCREAATSENPGGHNSHLHVEQLAKTLTTLRHMYEDLRKVSTSTSSPSTPSSPPPPPPPPPLQFPNGWGRRKLNSFEPWIEGRLVSTR